MLGARDQAQPVVRAVDTASPVQTEMAEMRRCLYELTAEVKKLALRSELGRVCDEEPQVRSLYRQFLDQEMEPDLALSLVQKVSGELSRQGLGDYRLVRERALAQLCQLVKCRGPVRKKGSKPRVLFVVGPTGVGKTTTLAKLAAQLAVVEGKRVMLVNADNYRIGAEAQLQIYADIMNLPAETVRDTKDLASLMHQERSTDFFLVDTPGRAQRNRDGLTDARDLIASVSPAGREVHLVVSAPTRLRELRDIVSSFSTLSVDALLITKLDEALNFGPTLSLLAGADLPVSYFTAGQSVPEDLEPATGERLVELVLRGY